MVRTPHLLALLLSLIAAIAYPQQPQPSAPVRIACIGNSITEGYGLTDPAHEAYPARMQQLLGAGYQVTNYGISGHTLLRGTDASYIDETTRHSFRQALASQPDIVTIKLGTNDSKARYDSLLHVDFIRDFHSLIDSLEALPSRPYIYLCLPIPSTGINYSIRDSVTVHEVIPRIRAVAQERHLPIIDLYQLMFPFPELLPDMVHPNAAGAMIIAQEIARRIELDRAKGVMRKTDND